MSINRSILNPGLLQAGVPMISTSCEKTAGASPEDSSTGSTSAAPPTNSFSDLVTTRRKLLGYGGLVLGFSALFKGCGIPGIEKALSLYDPRHSVFPSDLLEKIIISPKNRWKAHSSTEYPVDFENGFDVSWWIRLLNEASVRVFSSESRDFLEGVRVLVNDNSASKYDPQARVLYLRTGLFEGYTLEEIMHLGFLILSKIMNTEEEKKGAKPSDLVTYGRALALSLAQADCYPIRANPQSKSLAEKGGQMRMTEFMRTFPVDETLGEYLLTNALSGNRAFPVRVMQDFEQRALDNRLIAELAWFADQNPENLSYRKWIEVLDRRQETESIMNNSVFQNQETLFAGVRKLLNLLERKFSSANGYDDGKVSAYNSGVLLFLKNGKTLAFRPLALAFKLAKLRLEYLIEQARMGRSETIQPSLFNFDPDAEGVVKHPFVEVTPQLLEKWGLTL